MIYLLAQSISSQFLSWLITVFVTVMVIGVLNVIAVSRFFRKVGPEEAIVRSGAGGAHRAHSSVLSQAPAPSHKN